VRAKYCQVLRERDRPKRNDAMISHAALRAAGSGWRLAGVPISRHLEMEILAWFSPYITLLAAALLVLADGCLLRLDRCWVWILAWNLPVGCQEKASSCA
jgi:hypothetical protein